MKSSGKTSTQTRVTERRALGAVLRQAGLSREEELVLRMRHGISEPLETPIEYRGQGHEELMAKLALIELDALEHVRALQAAQPAAPASAADQAIIERLKRI